MGSNPIIRPIFFFPYPIRVFPLFKQSRVLTDFNESAAVLRLYTGFSVLPRWPTFDNRHSHNLLIDMNSVFEKLESLGSTPHGGVKHLAMRDASDIYYPKPERFPATYKDIEQLQNNYGLRFPPIYAEFLLHYGLSYFFGGWVAYPAPEDFDEDACNDLRVLYGINKDPNIQEYSTWDLGSEIRSTRYRGLPNHFLPIGESDGLATVVYISCREQDYGHVYALTRNQIWDLPTEEMCEAAHLIANSFEEFVQILEIDSINSG